MANQVEKVNAIAIADIEKIIGLTDDNIEKINGLEFTGTLPDAHTLIATATASSSSSLTFTSGIDSTYDVYEFEFINLHAATNSVFFQFQVNATDGADYNDSAITSTFYAAYHDESDGFAAVSYEAGDDFQQSTSDIRLTKWVANGNDESLSGKLTLYAPSSPTYVKHFMSRISNYKIESSTSDTHVAGYINDTTAIDEIRFKMSSGNIDDGTIYMYGVS
tara:strand:- start:55 stop:714 length:660 start_codon:yes stop_codon:yes gene_type:complete